ncbi:SagB/ThcOx family dehydrogenase [Tepidimicrobium xylanilyticum]|uniref:SagB-type dehydrogenase domain-containing protein n=1 Tax=Tepidimicrobium xylanilyticum TaxID=1123352 RepID=A0A1H2Z8Z9_9FIRM|nr:SagB/ThcOx family dehydrogenase [Tepidimicrobium xylanilyticum]GMG96418.1 thioester oxidase [Tepidimicrobium xylanilyticum]SDX13805.1 SagB-type dehydrogenase domain-containing protein [Tepidimicrobium xylanilyticum]
MDKTIGQEFMEKTKYQYLEESDQQKGLPQPSLELEYAKDGTLIDLPKAEDIEVKPLDLREAIESRKSLRKYADKPLTIEELSYLLWCTQGVKTITSRPSTLRNVPSAGARHSFETYLLINMVDGMKPGLYRYLAIEHKLLEINTEHDIANKMSKSCLDQIFVKNSAVTFMWTTIIYRMKWRYGERGYRYIHLDAGHVCQNLYLAAQSIDCGVCAIAAFDDDEINNLLGLDGEEQFVVYIGTVGKKIE